MDGSRLLTAIGLIRQGRPGGFCPACRLLMKARDARQEPAKPIHLLRQRAELDTLRDFLRVGSFESKRAERPNVL
jgi:hypothetical protein